MRQNGCWIFSFIFILTTAISTANETPVERLNFKTVLELAFAENPQMVEARKLIAAAQGELITAQTLKNPEVELEFGGFKKDDHGERNTNLDTIEIRQPFDPLGVRFFNSKIAANQVKIQDAGLRLTWAEVYKEVRAIYSKIILDQKRLELATDNLNVMRSFFGRVQERYQSGSVFKNDFQRAKIELLTAEHDYLAAEKDLKSDHAKLNLALGRTMDTDFTIEEQLEVERLQSSIEQLKVIALQNRPDIQMAELALDSTNKRVMKEQLSRLPSYSVGFQRTDKEYEEDYAIMVGISLPLWNFNQGEVKKAQAERDIQTVKTSLVKNQAIFDVYTAFLEAELAQRQFELSKKSLEEANELLRLTNLRYSEGKIDFLNYLDQIKTSTAAKVNYYEGLFQLSSSMSNLESAIYASLRQEDFFNETF